MITEGHYLCKNLNLSIRLEPDFQAGGERVRVTIEDPLAMTQAECLYELTKATHYHLKEAIIIAMRRLMNQAIAQGLIKAIPFPSSPGASMKENMPGPLPAPHGIEADITFSTDEELL